MRTISADVSAILTGGARKNSVRLSVKDAGGTFRDLSTYPGENYTLTIGWGEDVDEPGIKWEANLLREMQSSSLAPLMADSPLNKGFSIASSYAPLIAPGRAVKVEYAIQAEGDPTAKTWVLAFTGWLDSVNWAGNGEITVTGRGEEAVLVDRYIERDRIYAFAQGATKGVYVYEAGRTYLSGDLVVPTDSKKNGHFYEITSAGVADSTEPAYPTSSGATVTQSGGVEFTEAGVTSTSTGTAVEDVMQQIITDNGLSVTLYTPSSPSWNVKWFQVARQPVFNELRLLADQIGWCLRFKYDSGSGTMKLTFYDPVRSNTTAVRTFAKTLVTKTSRAQVEVHDIRNVVRVVYSDSQDLDANKNPKRKYVEVSDSASITKYGRRFCEIAESSSSNIDTSTEATALANAVLGDLREPDVDLEHELALFPFAEVTDLYTFSADSVHYSSDQKLAVVGFQSFHSAAESRTTVRVRGRPSSGGDTWRHRTTRGPGQEPHAIAVMDSGLDAVVTMTTNPVGGVAGVITHGGNRDGRKTDFEIHVSTSNGFTPSSSTLKSVSNGTSFTISDLSPLDTHYLVYVPVTYNAARIVRGLPSAQTTFTPGALKAAHFNPEVTRGPVPPNGNFESWFNDSGSVPDHWAMVVGTWGLEVKRTQAVVRSGAYGLDFTDDVTTAPKIRSRYFPATAGLSFAVSAWVYPHGTIEAADELVVAIEWYDYAKASISTSSFTTDLNGLTGSVWTRIARTFVAPATTSFARVYIAKAAAKNFTVYVDDVEAIASDEGWHTVGGTGEPAYSNSWVAFTGGTTEAQFRRDGNQGRMRGWVKDGSSGTAAIFTLPAALWPLVAVLVPISSNGAFGELSISTAGVVAPTVGNTTKLSLDGVSWPLD